MIGPLARLVRRTGGFGVTKFDSSSSYWEQRYRRGGDSGVGSYGKFAKFKAQFLNQFVRENHVQSIIELGCGDGHQLSLANYPNHQGFDVSATAVNICRARFRSDSSKRIASMSEYHGEQAELALSLDVIFHLVEDVTFEQYMRLLFSASTRYVVIYSSNSDELNDVAVPHVRHREFGAWVGREATGWRLQAQIPNAYPFRGDYRTGSLADFYIYEKCKRHAPSELF